MVTIESLKKKLPDYFLKKQKITDDQQVNDIIKEVIDAHYYFASDYDLIAIDFWKGNVLNTIKYLFKFCKQNFPYEVEPKKDQTTRSPRTIIETAEKIGVDCKHYASWIGGILSALERKLGREIDWNYRFASYDFWDKEPGHVFIVVYINDDEIWVDPVLSFLNCRNPGYFYKIDKKISMLSRMSGIQNTTIKYKLGKLGYPQSYEQEWIENYSDGNGQNGGYGSNNYGGGSYKLDSNEYPVYNLQTGQEAVFSNNNGQEENILPGTMDNLYPPASEIPIIPNNEIINKDIQEEIEASKQKGSKKQLWIWGGIAVLLLIFLNNKKNKI